MATYIAIADSWGDVHEEFITRHGTYELAVRAIDGVINAAPVMDSVSQSGIYRIDGEVDDDVEFAIADVCGGERVGGLLAYYKGKQINVNATLVFSVNRYEDDEGEGVVVNMTRPKGMRTISA